MIEKRRGWTTFGRGISMTTLTITVNYAATTGFSYALSYTDAGGTYTATAVDAGTIAFTSSGKYTLQAANGTPVTFTFDTISVVLGSALANMSSRTCTTGTPIPFDLTSIVLPTIPSGQSSVTQSYQWCQEIPSASNSLKFKDPKLGLSNTTGSSGVPVPAFGSCAGCTGS
jgi:hypothetical protein